MGISKDKLVADPAIAYDGDSVIVLLRDAAGNALTSTAGSLNANVTNTVTVQATNLDIRDLSSASDSVTVVQGTSPWVVSATDLDIRNLVFATDKVDVSGSSVSITGDVNVTATNLDIRDLSHVADSIRIGDGTDFLAVNADGSINVTGTFTILGQYAEDSAHASGNVGIYNLAVRSDAPAVATSADGDYASQTVDAYNRLWVNAGANVSISSSAASVTTTSALLVASTAGRRRIMVQNAGTKPIYVGASGVTTASGIKLNSGGSYEFELGPALALHAVADSGTQDVRVMQVA